MPKLQTNINEQIDKCIDLGVGYLYEHQMANGEFCTYYSPDDKMQEWCVPDSITFTTTLIACCLLELKDMPRVKKIHNTAVGFLQYQMMAGGVWNYFAKWNPLFKYSPADVDGTLFACLLFKELKFDIPQNRDLLLANRNSAGLFYTWFISRPSVNLIMKYWRVAFREFKHPLKSVLFWVKNEAGRNDIDGAVNANMLYYLGLDEDTRPIIDYLINIIHDKKEDDCDKWYRNPFTVYYFISRNYGRISDLEPLKQPIIDRIYSQFNEDGSFGNSPMDTAFAISTLINFKHHDSFVDNAVENLINTQQSAGNWDRNIFFYSGPSKAVGWGSEEVTTGFCIEALCKYRSLKTL